MPGTRAILLTVLMAPLAAVAQDNNLARYPIIDGNGFDKPVEAGSVMAPAGWRVQGGVVWRQDPCTNSTYGVQLSVVSPDSTRSLSIHDVPSWTMTSQQMPQSACTATAYRSLTEFFQGHVPTMAAGATILDMRQRPDMVELLRANGTLPSAPPPAAGVSISPWSEAGEVLIAFTVNGQQYRASLICMIHFSHTVFALQGMQLPGMPEVPGQQFEMLTGRPNCASQAAPDGQLDFALTDSFIKSYQASQEWEAQVRQAGAPRPGAAVGSGGKTALQAVAERSKIITETSRFVNGTIMGVGESQVSTFDGVNSDIQKGILGVENYVDPTTGNTVQLDNNYTHAYSLPDGGHFQTNDPNFNPAVELGIEATPMTPVE